MVGARFFTVLAEMEGSGVCEESVGRKNSEAAVPNIIKLGIGDLGFRGFEVSRF